MSCGDLVEVVCTAGVLVRNDHVSTASPAYRAPVEKSSGVSIFRQTETPVYRAQQTSAVRSLTDFLRKQKNVDQLNVRASVPHNTRPLSRSINTINVAKGNQDGIVSHAEISLLTDLYLIHGETTINKCCGISSIRRRTNSARVTLQSLN